MTNDEAVDWEAESLEGRVEALRREMNALVPGYGDVQADRFNQWFAGERDAVLERFWAS